MDDNFELRVDDFFEDLSAEQEDYVLECGRERD